MGAPPLVRPAHQQSPLTTQNQNVGRHRLMAQFFHVLPPQVPGTDTAQPLEDGFRVKYFFVSLKQKKSICTCPR